MMARSGTKVSGVLASATDPRCGLALELPLDWNCPWHEWHCADFLALLLQHVLPKGFRRVHDFGLLHPKRKHLLARVQCLLQVRLPDTPLPKRCVLRCPRCGAPMRVIATRLTPTQAWRRTRQPNDGRSATT